MRVTYAMALSAGVLIGCVIGILWEVFSTQAIPVLVMALILIGVIAGLVLADELDVPDEEGIDGAAERDRWPE